MRFVRADDGALCGVCKGLARALDIPVGVLRLLWILSVLCLGFGLLLYILLAISLPRADKQATAYNARLFGVCGQIAKRTDLEPGIVRLLAICLLLMSGGTTLIGYIILYFILGDQKKVQSSESKPATPPVTT